MNKNYLVCGKCLDNAEVSNLRKTDEIGDIGSCECGKYGYMNELNMVEHGAFKAGQKKVEKARLERVAIWQSKKAERDLEKAKELAEHRARVAEPVKIRAITI